MCHITINGALLICPELVESITERQKCSCRCQDTYFRVKYRFTMGTNWVSKPLLVEHARTRAMVWAFERSLPRRSDLMDLDL